MRSGFCYYGTPPHRVAAAEYKNATPVTVAEDECNAHSSETERCDTCGALIIANAFPDANFRTYVEENIDADTDGALSEAEISAVTEMDISYKSITDLTGIEYFTNLVTLNANDNFFSSINISTLTKLEFLYLPHCYNLKDLDLTANTKLIDLDVSDTGLTELDLSNNSNAGLRMGENTASVVLEHCGVGYVEMSQFADLSRMTVVSGGTLGTDGWLKLDADATSVVYEYDTKSNPHIAAYFYVKIYINGTNAAHTYVANTTSKDEAHHYTQWCETCRTVDEASTAEHTFQYGYTKDYFNAQHKQYCTACDYSIIEACSYSSECNEICSECNLVTRTFELEEHSLIYTPWEDDGHDYACENCTLSGWYRFCTYEFDCTEACKECGRVNPNAVAHTETTVYNDGTHDKVCTVCAKVLEENVSHVYVYAASENVITESCKADGCPYGETATLNVPEKAVYQGESNQATVAYSENWAGGEAMIVYGGTANDGTTYTEVPVKAGEATASITVDGVTASANYTVAKATNEWIEFPSITSWTYGEYDFFENEPTATAKFGYADFYYRSAGDDVWQLPPPEDAGYYVVRARVPASHDWELLMTSIEFIVEKATPAADLYDFTLPTNLNVCDRLAKEATLTFKEGVFGMGQILEIRYFKDGVLLDGAPTTVGTYTVQIDVAEGQNYKKANDLTADSWTFTVDTPADNAHKGLALQSNDNGTHDMLCTVCEKIISDDMACGYERYIKKSMLVSPANCTSPDVFYMSCACGQKNGETFKDGYLDPDNHTEANGTLISNNDGTHNDVWICCNAAVAENVVCTPTLTDDTCLTAEICLCEYVIKTAATEHDFSGNYLSDEEGHWHKCANCSATDEKLAHTPEKDDGSCLTAILCSTCGYETTKGQTIHDFYGANLYDENGHWHKCERCNATAAKYEHSFTVREKDETHHWNKCEDCEAIDTKIAHSFTVPQKDSTNHWNKCSDCDATDTKVEHNGGVATCTAKAHCSICDIEHGEFNAENHSKATFVYAANADGETHTKKHECCNAIELENEAHTYAENGACVCGATLPPPNDSASDNANDNVVASTDGGGLSGGAIAGIVSGGVAVLSGGGFAIYWFIFKKRRLK